MRAPLAALRWVTRTGLRARQEATLFLAKSPADAAVRWCEKKSVEHHAGVRTYTHYISPHIYRPTATCCLYSTPPALGARARSFGTLCGRIQGPVTHVHLGLDPARYVQRRHVRTASTGFATGTAAGARASSVSCDPEEGRTALFQVPSTTYQKMAEGKAGDYH